MTIPIRPLGQINLDELQAHVGTLLAAKEMELLSATGRMSDMQARIDELEAQLAAQPALSVVPDAEDPAVEAVEPAADTEPEATSAVDLSTAGA